MFSFYSKKEYFGEYITYHGDPSELALPSKGYPRVLLHREGSQVSNLDIRTPNPHVRFLRTARSTTLVPV